MKSALNFDLKFIVRYGSAAVFGMRCALGNYDSAGFWLMVGFAMVFVVQD